MASPQGGRFSALLGLIAQLSRADKDREARGFESLGQGIQTGFGQMAANNRQQTGIEAQQASQQQNFDNRVALQKNAQGFSKIQNAQDRLDQEFDARTKAAARVTAQDKRLKFDSESRAIDTAGGLAKGIGDVVTKWREQSGKDAKNKADHELRVKQDAEATAAKKVTAEYAKNRELRSQEDQARQVRAETKALAQEGSKLAAKTRNKELKGQSDRVVIVGHMAERASKQLRTLIAAIEKTTRDDPRKEGLVARAAALEVEVGNLNKEHAELSRGLMEAIGSANSLTGSTGSTGPARIDALDELDNDMEDAAGGR